MQFFIGGPSEGHLRSPGVTNGFLPIAGDWDEIEIWEWSLSLRDTSSYMQLDLLRSPRDCDLRSNFDFDLSRSCHICFDAHWRDKNDGVKIIALSFETRKLSKNCFAKNDIFTFRDLWVLTPKRLILREIWENICERTFQELSGAFLIFAVALVGMEIVRIIWSHVISFGNLGTYWLSWPVVT